MIRSLEISNYALIHRISLAFGPGLNIITGETGAGKSIMLGALSMLLGARADTRVVTDKERKSVVEATFDVEGYMPVIRPLLEDEGLDIDDRELTLRREITPSGRSRSFINDTPVSLARLREVAVRLVDIHSQHQNLLLADPEYQLSIIDTLLPDSAAKEAYTKAYDDYRADLRAWQVAKRALASGQAELDLLTFRLSKLDELIPRPGEQAALEQERGRLTNVTAIKQRLRNAINLLEDDDNNIADMLRRASTEVSCISGLPEIETMDDRLESLRIDALDIADTLTIMNERLQDDPDRLEDVEDRLAMIYDLERTFGVDSVEALCDLHEELREKVTAISLGDDHVKRLATKAKASKKRAIDAAAVLTGQRREVAAVFAERLKESAIPLGMKNLSVDIAFAPADLSPTGADTVDFLFAFNKNQTPMPVKDTASGGEISRLMLSIKAIVASRLQLPSIVFDEVDTGVSGDVAHRMGLLMEQIARNIQVIAITHLPQVAAKGSMHFRVYKADTDTATNTHVDLLTPEERVAELALMLSGNAESPEAQATARTLLDAKSVQHS